MVKQLARSLLGAWRSRRWRGALLVAVLSDVLGFGVVLLPPLQWLLDAVTAAVLFAVLGFRWPLLTALAVEAVPGLDPGRGGPRGHGQETPACQPGHI